jgi:translation elongation factor EF-G
MIALVLDIYEDNEVITMLFANKIDEIDKEFKLNLKKFI